MNPSLPKAMRWRRLLRRCLGLALALVLLAFLLDRLFPLPLPDANRGSTVVLARDGSPLRAFADAQGIWSYPVSVDEVSPLYLQALIGYEDRWFWNHPGINPFASLRALMQMIANGRVVSGGSTLTMQVARILEPHPRSIGGKLRQSLRALQLEAHLGKREILELYLAHAPFGGTLQGVEAASWAYLGHSARQLSHAEAALLVVLPQAPSRLRPDRNASDARAARDKVLERMATLGVWTRDQVHDAGIEPVVARSLRPPLSAALLARRLHQRHPQDRRIQTTIDMQLQRSVEERVQGYMARLPERTSAAVLIVDNADLSVRAYLGSAEFADEARLGHVDMVQAWRSPGSTLKPFLYGLALDDGLIHSESLLVDAPQSFGDYRPGNFDQAFNGPVGAAEALRLSLNVPAVDLLDRVGAARFSARLANTGLQLRLARGVEPNLSIILGGTGVRMEDLAGAYAALSRNGVGGVVRFTEQDALVERRLLSPGAAWIIREILEANPRPGYRPDTFDTGSHPKVAWKTGTSYGFRDAWAMGTTRGHTVGVWIGRPDGTPLPGQYGAVTALPLLFQLVDSLPRPVVSANADAAPPTVSEVDICWPLGLAFDGKHPELCQRKHRAWILDGVIPPTFAARDAKSWSAGLVHVRVDADSGERLSPGCAALRTREIDIPRWPSLVYPWLSSDQRRRSSLPPLASRCADDGLDRNQDLRIDGIADHATVARAPNSDKPASVRLRALGTSGEVQWLVNGRLVASTQGAQFFEHPFVEPGEETITAMTEDGNWARVHVRVLR
ncbi:MAG: penicillin-binding protein 1C [Gammaproteobacteria bacterium]|nr:MAG: penicillin-binding protein 1C [Gammaproteobacteria bacterium]